MDDESSYGDGVIEWVESQAAAALQFSVSCADALERQAVGLLGIVLVGAGGALGYAVNLAEKGAPAWVLVGTTMSAVWLFAMAGVLTWRCLWAQEIWGPANDPAHLLQPGFELAAIRRVDLRNKQLALEGNRRRNDRVGLWLNRVRVASACTPLVFAVAAALAAWRT